MIKSEDEVRDFGTTLGKQLEPNAVLALIGDLGTGKTTLTKYIAEGLGIKERIVSPTFTIVHEYRSGRLPLFHFDVYRLESAEDLFEIGAEEYFYAGGVSVVNGRIRWRKSCPMRRCVSFLNTGKMKERGSTDVHFSS